MGHIRAYGGHYMIDLSSPLPVDQVSARLVPILPSKWPFENSFKSFFLDFPFRENPWEILRTSGVTLGTHPQALGGVQKYAPLGPSEIATHETHSSIHYPGPVGPDRIGSGRAAVE